MRGLPRHALCFRVRAPLGAALLAVLAPAAAAGDLARFSRATEVAAAPVPGRVLDLAFVGEDRIAVLLTDSVALYEQDGAALRRLDHLPLEATLDVRAPAGMIVSDAGDSSFWVSANVATGAVLFTIDGSRLKETQRSEALPFQGSPQGARFRPGTNLIDVTVAGLGSGPHLRAHAGETPWAIAPDGRLGVAGAWSVDSIGSAAALLWPGVWIVSSAQPPGTGDSLAIHGGVTRGTLVATFPAPAAVTALTARVRSDRAAIAAGIAEAGGHRIVVMEVARAHP
jgi:hypothetical protein